VQVNAGVVGGLEQFAVVCLLAHCSLVVPEILEPFSFFRSQIGSGRASQLKAFELFSASDIKNKNYFELPNTIVFQCAFIKIVLVKTI
jgi:hypothetical protein